MLLQAAAAAASREVGIEDPGRHLPLERRRPSRVQIRGSHLAEPGISAAALGLESWVDPDPAPVDPFLGCAVVWKDTGVQAG